MKKSFQPVSFNTWFDSTKLHEITDNKIILSDLFYKTIYPSIKSYVRRIEGNNSFNLDELYDELNNKRNGLL